MGISNELKETTNKREIKNNEDLSFSNSLNDNETPCSNVNHVKQLNESCCCGNETELKENIKMFSAYVAASHSWQWQYLVMLANRQLNLMEKMGRKPYRRHMFTRKCKRVHHVSVQPKIRSDLNEQQASSSSHHSSLTHSVLEKPITVTDVFQKQSSNTIKHPSPNVLQEKEARATNETRPHTGVQPNRDEEHQRPQNFLQNFPFASYLKICIVLFFFNAPIYSIIAAALFGSLHATGLFNPFLQKFHALCERMGLTQRLSFTEVMNELRVRRQERLQQQRSIRRETTVYEELQEQALQNSTVGETKIKPTLSNKQAPNSNNNVDTALPSSQRTLSQRFLYTVIWLYQLIVVFFCSLNPQWGPLVAFILPEHYSNFQSGTRTTPTSTSTSSSSSSSSTSTIPGCTFTTNSTGTTTATTPGSTDSTSATGSISTIRLGEELHCIEDDSSPNENAATYDPKQDLKMTKNDTLEDK